MPRTKVPVAIVTGAAHGIGRAISRQLLETGWRVGVVDLPGSGLKRSYNRYVRNVVLIEGDVTDEETARRAVGAVTDKFNRLDALVSNAGIMVRKPLRLLTLAEWRKVLDTNLTATFLLARAAERRLRAVKGAIVTIASTRALMSEPNTESYSASKGGLPRPGDQPWPRCPGQLRESRLDRDQPRPEIAAQGPPAASRRAGRLAARHCRDGRIPARRQTRGVHHRREFHPGRRDDAKDDLRGIAGRPAPS